MTGSARAFWTLIFIAAAVWSITTKDVVLGLDLRGGATLRYELEPPSSAAPGADVDEMIESTVETLRERIDGLGIKESSIARQGDTEIVIELPGSVREDAQAIKSVVARVGRLEWLIVAGDDPRNGMVLADQQQRLADLLAANTGATPDDLDLVSLQLAFPDVVYRWVAYSDKQLKVRRGVPLNADIEEVLEQAPLDVSDFLLVADSTSRAESFTGADVSEVGVGQDRNMGNAVAVTIDPARAAEFGDFTEKHVGEAIVIVLDGRLARDPATIRERLDGRFVIEAGGLTGFTDQEIREYITVIRSGSLQMKPRLLFENVIGPTLGESSIESGKVAGIAGLIALLIGMILYYRTTGVVAAVSLVVNMLLLAGVIVMLEATLTLPGIAGLVLTLGMAVDANILVFERMREEQEKGKDAAEVVKEGFARAFSTIIDANATTFVTAAILFNRGTGPIKGFAMVLMFGILTSLFSVLVSGRLMFDLLLKKEGRGAWSMARLLPAETHVPFMSKARVMLGVSSVAVVLSLVAFFSAGSSKYGLDFLGGYKAQVRLQDQADQGDVAERLAGTFPSVQVISVASDDASLGATSDRFMVKIKAGEGATGPLDEEYEEPVKAALAGLILDEGVTDLVLTPDETTATTDLSAVLHFEGPVSLAGVDEVGEQLSFISSADVAAAGERAVSVRGTIAATGHDPAQVIQQIYSALSDADGLPRINQPFIESTTIGSRVGGELRDKAIQAIILALIAIIIYIRVRFREYRYGYAAVVALTHDVIITLGMIVLARMLGIVDVEIDLAMIAAFLTIIGYSLNDTIVLFDRVRENLPRMKKPLEEVLDISINQTLSRTLLTSMTTLVVLLLIFILNYGKQNVLEGFAFAMIVGVLVGTYSSIFIASPVLMKLSKRSKGAH